MVATTLLAGSAVGQEPATAPEHRLKLAAPEAAAFPHTTLAGYPVDATSPSRIRAILNATGPKDEAGKRHHGLTTWSYRTRYATRNGECLPETATITYEITITLPDLVTRDLSRREGETWDRYFVALTRHEVNHARIYAAGMEKMLASMRSAKSCEALKAAVETVGAEIKAASIQYDRETRHGQVEGAVY